MVSEGRRIGNFDVLAKYKAGGMATLYLARRHGAAGFRKHVALKVIHEHLADDPKFREMFIAEAKLSALIRHPNVVHIEELGEFENTHYLVMEFVSGCSLRQLLKTLAQSQLRLAPEVAVHIMIKDSRRAARGA